MNRIKMSVALFALAIAALLPASAAAQKSRGKMLSTPPEVIVVAVNAIETSYGSAGFDASTHREVVYGHSFLGRTSGSMPGSLMLSLNCADTVESKIEFGDFPTISKEMVGGSWSMPVYAPSGFGSYLGSIYGAVTSGSMRTDHDGTSIDVIINLEITGGTQSWEGKTGYATFTGQMTTDKETQSTMLSGEMTVSLFSSSKSNSTVMKSKSLR